MYMCEKHLILAFQILGSMPARAPMPGLNGHYSVPVSVYYPSAGCWTKLSEEIDSFWRSQKLKIGTELVSGQKA